GVGRQQSDEEGADTHQRHCYYECVLAANDVAESTEEQCPEWTHCKAGGESKQRKDESRRRIDSRKELRRKNRRQRAVDIKVVPFEHGTERRSENDHPFLGRHCAFAILTRSHCCHGRCPVSNLFDFVENSLPHNRKRPPRSRNTPRARASL